MGSDNTSSVPTADGVTHRVTHGGWRIESSGVVAVNCGPANNPEMFTCCEIAEIHDRMAQGMDGGVDLDELLPDLEDDR